MPEMKRALGFVWLAAHLPRIDLRLGGAPAGLTMGGESQKTTRQYSVTGGQR
jgi:hypothetical protein